jgi:hypothetical protein
MRKFILVITVVCFIFCENLMFSQEEQVRSTREESNSFSHDSNKIVLSMIHVNSSSIQIEPDQSFVQLVIWEDGQVFAGKYKSSKETREVTIINYEYRLGKIDSGKVQSLLHSIETNLRLKSRQTRIRDVPFDAGYFELQVDYADGPLIVELYEGYYPAERYPNRNVIVDSPVADDVLLLPDFYRGWKVIKEELWDIRDKVMADPNSELMEVWRSRSNRNTLLVRDKSGEIMEYTWPFGSATFTPAKTAAVPVEAATIKATEKRQVPQRKGILRSVFSAPRR